MKKPSKVREKQRAGEIIAQLSQKGFHLQCPNCDESPRLKDCNLFYGDNFTEETWDAYESRRNEQSNRLEYLESKMGNIPSRSTVGAKAVNTGLIIERLAPCLNSFSFDNADCRSLFDPIDYLVFEGLRDDRVRRIIFLELKTGQSRLSGTQRRIRELVEEKRVSMRVHKMGEQ